MANVLVVDDDPAVQAALVHALRGLGHSARAVGTAAAALREATTGDFDLVLLDLGLPDLDGVVALRMLRSVSNVPVLVATARALEESVVLGLEAGADDYIVKPFSGRHLAARVNAILRRTGDGQNGKSHQDMTRIGELTIDFGRRHAELRSRPISLTRREFDLLAYLARRPGRVVTRREIHVSVWDQPHMSDDRTLDVHVSWLRRKLGETAAEPAFLHTVRGVGFKLDAPS